MIKFKKILIFGLGIIGGSLAKALKSKDSSIIIYGYDIDEESLKNAEKDKIIDGYIKNGDKIDNFDLIVISSNLDSYREIFDIINKKASKESMIIDLGSLKEFVDKLVPKELKKNFIACHPIAGSEKSGYSNSQTDLFESKKFIICKNNSNNDTDISKIEELAKFIGSEPVFLDVKEHDKIFGLISHLPQFLSFLTSKYQPKLTDDLLKRIFRLDSSNPEIWKDIFSINEANLENYYIEFFDNLMFFADKLEDNKIDQIIDKSYDIINKNELEDLNFDLSSISPNLLFRLLIILSYLDISDIKKYVNHSGLGFKDFTLIKNFLILPRDQLFKLFKTNKSKILDLIVQISS